MTVAKWSGLGNVRKPYLILYGHLELQTEKCHGFDVKALRQLLSFKPDYVFVNSNLGQAYTSAIVNNKTSLLPSTQYLMKMF